MSLTRCNYKPYVFYSLYTFQKSIGSVWSIIKDPMFLYSLLVSYKSDMKIQALFPSFPLLFDLLEINKFNFGNNYDVFLNISNSLESDYFCRCFLTLKENDEIRSTLRLSVHYLEDNSTLFIL